MLTVTSPFGGGPPALGDYSGMHVCTMAMTPPALLAVQPDRVTLVLREGLVRPSVVKILERILGPLTVTIKDSHDVVRLETNQQDGPSQWQGAAG